jgi:hypothetical protein
VKKNEQEKLQREKSLIKITVMCALKITLHRIKINGKKSFKDHIFSTYITVDIFQE